MTAMENSYTEKNAGFVHVHEPRARKTGTAWSSFSKLRPRRGMTMIEIMIVVVILGVMAMVAVPQMSGMNRKNKLRAAARQIVALTKAARAEAVFGERTTELVLDVKKQRYWLDLRKPKEEKKTGTRTSAKKGTRDKNAKSMLEEVHELKDGITIKEVNAYDENILKDSLIAVDFHPDGTASPTMLSLHNEQGQAITIQILRASGTAEVTPGTMEQKQAAIEATAQQAAPPPSRSNAGEI